MNARQLDFIAALEAIVVPAPVESQLSPERREEGALPDLNGKARELLREIGCVQLAKDVRVVWHTRLRTTAGQAYYAKMLVRLNPRLTQFGHEEVDKTLRHELAHLVARFRAGRRRIEPHGVEWRAACRELGIKDEKRCHDLPLPRSRQRIRHRYHCPRCHRDYDRVRPFRRAVACMECCRAHAGGKYDERFRLVKVR